MTQEENRHGAFSITGDDKSMSLERRISYAARYVIERRTKRSITVDGIFVYHKSAMENTVRTKSIVVTATQVYSVKAKLDHNSNEFKSVEVSLEVPRGRRDFRVEIVENRKGNQFLIPYLGDMKLQGILVESDDLFTPEEISQQLCDLVHEGDVGWEDANLQRLALTEPELDVVRVFTRVMRFETMLRGCILEAMKGTYDGNTSNRIERAIGEELARVASRVTAMQERYGQTPVSLDNCQLFHFFGFEHYITLLEDNNIWEKCLGCVFKDKSQAIEGIKVIRDVRNEIAHFRQSSHSHLWAAGEMYIDILEGRIKMTDPAFRKLVKKADE